MSQTSRLLQGSVRPAEDADQECMRCGKLVQLREHSEHDGFCDSCAHEEIVSLATTLTRLVVVGNALNLILPTASGNAVLAEFREALAAAQPNMHTSNPSQKK